MLMWRQLKGLPAASMSIQGAILYGKVAPSKCTVHCSSVPIPEASLLCWTKTRQQRFAWMTRLLSQWVTPGMPLSTSVRPHNRVLAPTEGPWTCGNGPQLSHQWSCPILFKIPSVPLFAQWNYKKKFPLIPFYKIKSPKTTFFKLVF